MCHLIPLGSKLFAKVFQQKTKVAIARKVLKVSFKPNGLSHFNQLDQSISILRVVQRYFSFVFKF